jgi:hypothetical protein
MCILMGVPRGRHSHWLTYALQGDKVRSQVIRMVGESQEAVGAAAGGGSGPGSNKLPTLEEYGTNLTTQATEVSLCNHSQSSMLEALIVEHPTTHSL